MEWISVKDQLPEDGEYVLIYNFTDYPKGIQCAVFIKEFSDEFGDLNRWQSQDGGTFVYSEWNEVTHWMHLPEPPKD